MEITSKDRVIYTVREVSRLLRTNPAYVYELINTGILPAIRLASIRVRKEALDTFLRENEGKDLSDLDDIKPLNQAG